MSRKPPPHLPYDDEPTETGLAPLPELEGLDDDALDWEDEKTLPGVPLDVDLFEDSNVSLSGLVLDPNARSTGRIRFGPEQLAAAVAQAVKVAGVRKGPLDRVRSALKGELLPLLRAAVEQAGGDGLDAHLDSVPATAPLVSQLTAQMDRVNRATELSTVVAEAAKLAPIVRRALAGTAPRPVSSMRLEAASEGRIDLEAYLDILFSSDEELRSRLAQASRTLESLRTQLALMSSFARLKVEKRLIEAELSRR